MVEAWWCDGEVVVVTWSGDGGVLGERYSLKKSPGGRGIAESYTLHHEWCRATRFDCSLTNAICGGKVTGG